MYCREDAFRCTCSAGEHSYLFREEKENPRAGSRCRVTAVRPPGGQSQVVPGWKYFGKEGLGERVRRYLELAAHAEARINGHPELEMVAPRESLQCLLSLPPAGKPGSRRVQPEAAPPPLPRRVSLVGVAFIGERVTLRLLITHPDFTEAQVDDFLDSLVQAARELLEEEQ